MTSLSYTVGRGYPKLLWQTYYCGLVSGPHVEKQQEVIPNSLSDCVTFIVYTSLLKNVAAGRGLETRAVGDLFTSPISAFGQLFLDAFAELRKATFSFAMSVRPFVCPHGTARLPLDGYS